MKRIEVDSYLVSERVGDIGKFEKTLTQQNFAEEVDVNMIVDRALKTGFLGDPFKIAERQAIFADVSSIGDYNEVMKKMVNAQGAFMELPADVRARFGNDPGQLLAFIVDPKNFEEAIKLGLAVKRAAPAAPAA